MKQIQLAVLLIFIGMLVNAQTKVSGIVTDTKGETLIGVNISLLNSYDGATSKLNGDYSFETFEQDSVTLKASYTGYSTQEKRVKLEGKELIVNFELKEKVSDLKAVVISAGSFEASDEKKGTVLKALDIVTTAGSSGDTYGALKTLPGTQQTNDREGLFVRGGTGAETQTFIDGTWVKNAFSASIPDLGARGRFNPFIFKGTVFSAGGYSALYGQALSSAVILETIDLPERSSANFNLSSVGIGGSIQTLSKNKKESFGVGYNYVNLTPYFALIKQNIDYKTAPTVHQIDLNYRAKISQSGIIKFYGYLNNTKINIERANVDSRDYDNPKFEYNDEFSVKNNNVYGNLSYKDYFKKGWKLNIGLSASYNHDDINTKVLNESNQVVSDSNFANRNWLNIENGNSQITTKLVIEKSLNNLNAIRFGAEYIYGGDHNFVQLKSDSLQSITFTDKRLVDNFTSLFAETDIYITNEIAGKVGVRGEYSSLLNQFNIAPRVSAAYKLKRAGQFSIAYGMFYQKPEQRYLLQNQNLQYMRADHYIINYQYQPKDRLLRLEAYYKNYDQLIKSNGIPNNNGLGYARGIELFYRDKKSIKGIDFWISYSFIDSKRDFSNYIKLVQPDFVANHVGSFVFKKFWTKYMFGINGTYTYSSGRPYINANKLESSNFMSDRTIDYHNFSISANYLKTIKKAFTVFVLSINNPFGFKQVYGNNFASKDLNGDGLLYKQAITPTARQFVFIGMFMSWGIDRTQEAIDGNL
ncbi:MAG TPA: TonB-dependent receptor [Chitinophagaceae bacterium]|nr:TonB-dependent receptor [Chitinophagaceae bacterium]